MHQYLVSLCSFPNFAAYIIHQSTPHRSHDWKQNGGIGTTAVVLERTYLGLENERRLGGGRQCAVIGGLTACFKHLPLAYGQRLPLTYHNVNVS